MLQYTRMEWFVGDKPSSLLDPFISYEENEVFWIHHQLHSYEGTHKALHFGKNRAKLVGFEEQKNISPF